MRGRGCSEAASVAQKSVRKMAASIRSGKQDEDSRSHQSLNTGGVAGGRADLSLEHQPQVGKQLAGTGLAGSSEDNSSLREAASELFPLPPPHDVNYWLTAYKVPVAPHLSAPRDWARGFAGLTPLVCRPPMSSVEAGEGGQQPDLLPVNRSWPLTLSSPSPLFALPFLCRRSC